MAFVKCEKGIHFYDNSKYDSCPHCSKPTNSWVDIDMGSFNEAPTEAVEEQDINIIETVGVIQENQYSFDEQFKDEIEIEDDVTIAAYSPQKGNDFITGWLVCVEGPERGRYYRIFHGVNKLGRDDSMDIIIKEDRSISREKVCSIVYDDRSNTFYLVPSSNGLIYLNGEHITRSQEIKNGDVRSIGESSFEVVTFCRGDKKWI